MNAQLLAKTAYGAAATPVRTDRGTEYALFTQVTQRLKAAALKGPSHYNELVRALHDNRMMWVTLAADVADRENELSKELRARIFFLAEFTKSHTSKVIGGRASVQALIDVNASIMRGLGQRAVPS